MKITVFTPTYNRAYTIDRLYKSLQRQSYQDFEWIVIDDGSTDNTSLLFEQYSSDKNDFTIKYCKCENGGKHRAINKGVRMASGELFFIVDSDDWLPEKALEVIVAIENTIPNDRKTQFAGVCGLMGNTDQASVGDTFEGKVLDATYLESATFGIHGDKAEVYYTTVLKKYKFPEFAGENFIAESTVWNVIAADGMKLRYFNELVYYCEYLPDGLTAQADEKIKENPKGYGLLIQQNICYNRISGMTKWNEIRKYYRMLRGSCSVSEIAQNLDMNPAILYLRMLGMKLFYRLYR